MKFVSITSFQTVSAALRFDTPDCQVKGSCELYTTKAVGSDKKLYKNISQSLDSQRAALVKATASLSPPQQQQLAASLDTPSPFGSLNKTSNRRTFAYLLGVLNASHGDDYDFSQVPRPSEFQREDLRSVKLHINNTLSSVRPGTNPFDDSLSPVWGPHTWRLMDDEMSLNDCMVFSWHPHESTFEDDEGSVWNFHYFFFNKALKRVCYLWARGIPVMSHSPRQSSRMRQRRLAAIGATKRADYWLGDRAQDVSRQDDLVWNRAPDGTIIGNGSDVDDDYFSDDFDASEDFDSESINDAGSDHSVSDDIAAGMELEV